MLGPLRVKRQKRGKGGSGKGGTGRGGVPSYRAVSRAMFPLIPGRRFRLSQSILMYDALDRWASSNSRGYCYCTLLEIVTYSNPTVESFWDAFFSVAKWTHLSSPETGSGPG